MSEQTFADRLRLVQGRESVNAMATRCGIPYTTLRQYFGGTEPSATNAAKIADTLGVDLEWLITGRGDTQPTGLKEDVSPFGYVAQFAQAFVAIPRLDGALAPIVDGTPDQEELGEILAFRREWLTKMGVLPEYARLFVIKGDAMTPTLQSGDAILVDTSENDVEELGIYVIRADDRLMVRRIAPKINGSLQIMSDNLMYPGEVVTAEEATVLGIVGQVRWFGRSI